MKGSFTMYKKMYLKLFNAVSDAMDLMEAHKYQEAIMLLEQASQETEEIYISQEDEA